MPTETTRLNLNLPAELVRQVEKYWHLQELRSRTDAIADLLAAGLKAIATEQKARKR